jgi:hypothetical protein
MVMLSPHTHIQVPPLSSISLPDLPKTRWILLLMIDRPFLTPREGNHAFCLEGNHAFCLKPYLSPSPHYTVPKFGADLTGCMGRSVLACNSSSLVTFF